MAVLEFSTREQAKSVPDPKHIWHRLENKKFPWVAFTGSDIPVVGQDRPRVSKWAFVEACIAAGINEAQIDAAVATLSLRRQRLYRLASEIDRDWPIAGAIRTAITPTPPTAGVWNNIFIAANSLYPEKI